MGADIIGGTAEALKAGGKAAGEEMWQGFNNVIKGIWDSNPQNRVSSLPAHDFGKSVLGGLQIVNGLGAGVGTTLQEALKQYSPGAESSNSFLPTGLTGTVRAVLGAPMLLDKNFRERISTKEGLQQVLDELYKPMTYGELFNLVGNIAAYPAASKLISKFREARPGIPSGKMQPIAPEGPLASPEGPSLAFPTNQPLALPPASGMIGPIDTTTAQTIRICVGKGESEAVKKATPMPVSSIPKEPIPAPGEVPAPAPEPLRSASELSMDKTDYMTKLQSSMDIAIERSRKIIEEELAPEVAAPEKAPAEVAMPAKELQGLAEFVTPKAGRRARKAPPTSPETATGVTDILKSEGGFVDPLMAAHMVVGAAVGGTQGDTPEERIRNMLIGMGVGAASSRISKRVIESLKKDAPRVLDDSIPTVPGYRTPAPASTVEMPKSGGLSAEEIIRTKRITPEQASDARKISLQATQQVFETARKIQRGEDVPAGDLKYAVGLSAKLQRIVKDKV